MRGGVVSDDERGDLEGGGSWASQMEEGRRRNAAGIRRGRIITSMWEGKGKAVKRRET